jgi:hypothetical protein
MALAAGSQRPGVAFGPAAAKWDRVAEFLKAEFTAP